MNASIHPFTKWVIGIILATSLVQLVSTDQARAQVITIGFGETKIENHYPDGMRFSIKVTLGRASGTVSFHYQLNTKEWFYDDANCQVVGPEGDRYQSCVFFVDLAGFPPQTPVTFKWEFFGTVHAVSDEILVNFDDPAYEWNSRNRENLTLWWHDYPDEFAERALNAAASAAAAQEKFFATDLGSPLQLIVTNSVDEYNNWDQDADYQSYGSALPHYNMTVQIIELPDYDLWIESVFAHEISHLYFFRATNQDKTHPKWMDEGMAVYNEPRGHPQEWSRVNSAAANNLLIPLSELRYSFGSDGDRVALAYAESFIAVEYMVETYGQDGITALFKEYQSGKNTEEAFLSAFGITLEEFENNWLLWVKNRGAARTNAILFTLYALCACCLIGSGALAGGGVLLIVSIGSRETRAQNQSI